MIFVAGIACAQTNGSAADQRFIEKVESEWAESVASHDCTVPNRIMAEDFIGVDVDGSRYTKQDALKECRTQPSKFEFNHLTEVRISFYGDTAIARGSESWKLKTGKSGKFVWTDTWLKREGKWQVIAAEDLIPVPSPFGEAPGQK